MRCVVHRLVQRRPNRRIGGAQPSARPRPSCGTICSARVAAARACRRRVRAARSGEAGRCRTRRRGRRARRRRRAEPLGLAGEVTAGLVGVQVGLGHQVAHAGLWPAPSRRSRCVMNSCSIARLSSGSSGRRRPSTAARAAGRCAWRPARLSARCTSMSGLMPGSSRRKTLRIATSPKTSEVLDCSPVSTRLGLSTGMSSRLGDSARSAPRPVRRVASRIPSQPDAGDVLVVQRVVDPAGSLSGVDRAEQDVLERCSAAPSQHQRQLVGLGRRRRRRSTVASQIVDLGVARVRSVSSRAAPTSDIRGPCRRTSAGCGSHARRAALPGRHTVSRSRRRLACPLPRGRFAGRLRTAWDAQPVEAVPGRVSRYGSSPIVGKRAPPINSIGSRALATAAGPARPAAGSGTGCSRTARCRRRTRGRRRARSGCCRRGR